MVRLKAGPDNMWQGIYRFQFHYGTIKRQGRIPQWLPEPTFQFHYGTIKSMSPHSRMNDSQAISIPLWYD